MSKLSAIIAAGILMLALGTQGAQAHDKRGYGYNKGGHHHAAYHGKHWNKGHRHVRYPRHVRYIAPPFYTRNHWVPVRYVQAPPPVTVYRSSGFSFWLY
jgi:hypothetical protein